MRAGSFVHCNPVSRTVLGTQMVIHKYLLNEKNVQGLHSESPVRLQSSFSNSMFFQNELWLGIRL